MVSFLWLAPRIGITSSKLKIQDNVANVKEGDARFGFQAGLFTRFTISSFSIQPEVLFTNNGGKIEFDDNFGKKVVRKYEYNKLDVPVMLGYKFANFIRIQARPVASLLLKADAKDGGVKEDVKNNYKNATFGYQAGIGFDIGSILIDLKYEGNLSKFGDEIVVDGTSFNTDLRNNQLILSLGLKL